MSSIAIGALIGALIGASGAILNTFALAQTYATVQVTGTPTTFRGVLRRYGLEIFTCWVILGALVGAGLGWAALVDGV